MATRGQEIDWDSMDKWKFFVYGAGSFSAVTTLLYPMIVVKTRVQASHEAGSSGFSGALRVAQTVVKNEGVLGLYRGYTTIICGMIPGRMVYLTSLEIFKSGIKKVGQQFDISETALSGISNTGAGALASLITQMVVVPIDIVSQRQMVASLASSKAAAAAATEVARSSATIAAAATATVSSHVPGPSASAAQAAGSTRIKDSLGDQKSGLHTWTSRRSGAGVAPPVNYMRLAQFSTAPGGVEQPVKVPAASGMSIFRQILKEEGVRGLYRGFGASVAVFVPSSALWWGSYGMYQKLIWNRLEKNSVSSSGVLSPGSTSETILVQSTSSMLAGVTASFATSPLDLVKTRIQVARKRDGQATTFRAVWEEIVREEGYRGMFRGAVPRMANAALWGTCMVSTYEFLKRVAKKDPAEC